MIQDKLVSWKKNWIPYKQLTEELKDYDREWADKIIDNVPFKCPLHQCGNFMMAEVRGPPEYYVESEGGYDGDEQTPDLVCINCGAIYQFAGFKEVNKNGNIKNM